MNRAFLVRLSRIEAAQGPPPFRAAILPCDVLSGGAEFLAVAEAEAAREYEARTGLPPTLLIITGVPR